MPKDIFEFEEARLEQVEDYALRNEVLGLVDVQNGVRVLYPTTIYNVKGDETSGVAGILFANGTFTPAQPSRVGEQARYWEYDETLRYEPVLDEAGQRVNVPGPYGRTYQQVKGNSWTEGEVAWDGAVTNSINHSALAGDETDTIREVVKRREWDAPLTGEWASTGELWKAIMSARAMVEMAPRPGKVHLNHLQTNSGWAA
jgi:hypothetical protein